jgi:sugar lactone lactonase YvrE
MGAAGVSAGGGGVVWADPDLENASYHGVSFSVSSEESNPQGLFFKPDGTKMYVIGDYGDTIYQYSTA